MKIVCVDDEPLLLNTVVSLCKKLPQQNEVITFTKARKALDSSVKQTYDTSPVTIDRNVSFEFVSYTRRTRAAFDRYIATLDKMAGMKVS